ncbi:MAG: SRPBCC domain-containing protein [Alphaproteobacteria bacterium]|nr:SRPBCC domain-containing protein [Alphaproteobacteria bacterium]
MAPAANAKGDREQLQPLRLSRVFHASRQTVFAAWTTARHVEHWFCPEGCTVCEVRVEPWAGGRFELLMRSPGGEHWIRGAFVEIAPHTRLAIDMTVTAATGEPLFRACTEAEFSDELGGTRVDLVQTYTLVDPTAAWMVAGAPEGWRSTLDRLEQAVVRMRGGGETGVRSVIHDTFELRRSYDAPIARVWQALTEPTAKERWFGGPPGRFEVLERQMDVRVGGRERLRGRWEGGLVSTFDAVYHDVIPNERLIYSYEMRLDDKKISVSLATLRLKAEGGQTSLIVTEQGAFLDGYEDGGSREAGTGHLLDALGASLQA